MLSWSQHPLQNQMKGIPTEVVTFVAKQVRDDNSTENLSLKNNGGIFVS